ncbi:MAG: hypothetical protein Q8R91_09625 [Candidatus Omnitrophota bacterium]|nr:hypothetical protein [Candidatus Omnitrophota bacterium]
MDEGPRVEQGRHASSSRTIACDCCGETFATEEARQQHEEQCVKERSGGSAKEQDAAEESAAGEHDEPPGRIRSETGG